MPYLTLKLRQGESILCFIINASITLFPVSMYEENIGNISKFQNLKTEGAEQIYLKFCSSGGETKKLYSSPGRIDLKSQMD